MDVMTSAAQGVQAALQAVLRIANEHPTPIWTSSQGRNKGHGEYRSHPDFMDEVASLYHFNNNIQRRFAETIKDCLDPNGILSPGKQGIWPASYRDKA